MSRLVANLQRLRPTFQRTAAEEISQWKQQNQCVRVRGMRGKASSERKQI
jgi:hypothetical protein